MSIANQRNMLTDYVNEKGWNVRDCYIDDGFSGTNFERPEFKRMIRDVELGKIDCIVTKDLSRLGRNYVQTGYYTDEYFVEHGIRFIAINDSIDTLQDNNDIAAFHHVLNELYPKQVSKKVRQVKKASAKQGKFMGSQAPFGYKKSPIDKHILIIDEFAAKIVLRIFNEFASGDSARLIGDRFNHEGIDSPRFYHYKNIGRENPYPADKNVWGSATITQILRNQVYIGNMIQAKRQVVSFKTKKVKANSPEDWIIVENTHKPIISRELWDRAHSLLQDYSKEQTELEEKLSELQKQAEMAYEAENEVSGWLKLISRQIDIVELDRVTVMELIDSITISEGKKTNGKRTQEISIQYRFVGNLSHKSKEDIA